jgi:hypothetical protein
MDGENTTLYRDYLHNRALEYEPHPSRGRIKALHGRIAHEIPDGWRLSVENLYAQHSILYRNLDDWHLLFGIWNEKNELLPWSETVEWAELLGLKMPRTLYAGEWNQDAVQGILDEFKTDELDDQGNPIYRIDGDVVEGYVVRLLRSIHYKEFRTCVGKFVRKGHVAVHGGNWKSRQVTANSLRSTELPDI